MLRMSVFPLFNSVILSTSLLLLSGCMGGSSDKFQPSLGQVKGTIKLNGQPLPNALVDFIPASAGRMSSGTTDTSGVYTLSYDASNAGAAVGEHVVRISTKVGAVGDPEKVPARYNSTSELKATVKAGDNTIDFNLEPK